MIRRLESGTSLLAWGLACAALGLVMLWLAILGIYELLRPD